MVFLPRCVDTFQDVLHGTLIVGCVVFLPDNPGESKPGVYFSHEVQKVKLIR